MGAVLEDRGEGWVSEVGDFIEGTVEALQVLVLGVRACKSMKRLLSSSMPLMLEVSRTRPYETLLLRSYNNIIL